MHVPDGFLSNEVAAAAAAVSAVTLAVAVRRAGRALDDDRVPLLGVTAAFVFAAQMVNFPVAGGTSGHLLGAALAALLLGPWLACIVLAVVTTTQALVFADGGVTALGANVLSMGIVGALGVGGLMLLARRVAPRTRPAFLAVAAAGAWLAVMAGALLTALALGASGTVPYATVIPAMLGVHALIGLGEAAITVAAAGAVLAARPDLIHGAGFASLPAPPAPAAPTEGVVGP